MKLPIIALGILLASFSASQADEVRTGINLAALCQQWVHSAEEGQPDGMVQIYRPANFAKFPPSRFRMEYKFFQSGECQWLYLSPDDDHHFKTGNWVLDPKDKTLLRITTEGATVSFKITALSKDMLCLLPVETKRGK